MSGATCPSCGVAVVPGYVRCPKCRKPLPQRQRAVEGGTAIEGSPSRVPLAVGALAAVVLIGGAIAYFATRHKNTPVTAAPAARPAEPVVEPTAAEPASTVPTATATAPAAATGPDPGALAAELETALKKQRLWSTVEIIGGRAQVRSESCGDAAMKPMLDGAAPAFKAAGLTKLRCVEQSGRVVSDRDL